MIAKLIVNSVVNQLQSVHRRVLFCKIHCEIKHNSLREYAVVIFRYSQTSLIRTPKGQNQMPALQRCPYYRGRECVIISISGTKRTVRKERLDCSFYKLQIGDRKPVLSKNYHTRNDS